MAVIKTKASGSGKFLNGASWEGGVKPGVGDTAELVGTFNLEIAAVAKCQALIAAPGYTGTLSGSANLELGEALAQSENIIFKLVSGSISTWTGELLLKSTNATTQAIFSGGKTLTAIVISKSGKYILEEALTTSSEIKLSETSSLNTNGQTIKALAVTNTGTGTLTLGASKITVTNTTTAWSTEGTLSAGTSEIILTGAKAIFAGKEKTYNIVVLEGAEQQLTNANTIAELKINNKGDTSGIKLQVVVHTVTTLTTNGTEAEPAKLISLTNGAKATIKLTGTQTVSFLKAKDIKVETGALKDKIPNGGKEAYDLTGNEGITFEEAEAAAAARSVTVI